MASDLKIEIFVYNALHLMWYDMQAIEEAPKVLEIYGREFVLDESYTEICDDSFKNAVCAQSDFFYLIYKEKISNEEIYNLQSLSEVNEYIIRVCDYLFGHLVVFDRMLATIEFVANACYDIHNHTDGDIEALKYGHIMWAMYFDQFTVEFYGKGGWSKLKKEAKCYELIDDFNLNFIANPPIYFSRVKEATVNYFRFKNAVNFQEPKLKHKVHVSKLWIQFQTEHILSYIHIPSSYSTSLNIYNGALLIEDLKLALDFTRWSHGDNKLSADKHPVSPFLAEMSSSKIHCASKEIKNNHDEDMQIQNLSYENETRIINQRSDDFSSVLENFKGLSLNRSETSVIEESTFAIETNENLKLDKNTVMKIELSTKTRSADTTEDLRIEQTLFPAVDTKKLCRKTIQNLPNLDSDLNCKSKLYNTNESITNEFSYEMYVQSGFGTVGPYFEHYERNTDAQTDISNSDQVPFCNQMEENECHTFSSNDQTMSSVSGYVNQNKNNDIELKDSEVMLKIKSDSKNGQIKTAEPNNDSSEIQIDAPDKYGFSMGRSVNENVNERENIMRLDDLRNEQEDPEMRNLLRMLPVVGDMEGTKLLLSMLQKHKEQSENSQKSINKTKKKKRK